ncbi:MauE/DoxX family redox-associated membrane protein [Synechococcus sp. CS-1325]|uniref:MauE/DoxX family redox-associated membrane protein n=1 Tax=Synechococcus sp. CS-1325 TaxID=2847979 RepID=UPI00223B38C7|nr:MauE/DoxX family redox-associated membrane protein [Synechococcus sp. CS-1325]
MTLHLNGDLTVNGSAAEAMATPAPLPLPLPVRLHRIATAQHVCPYGQQAAALLRQQGIHFEDHLLLSQGEVERFKTAHGVTTTPQVFAGDERIGGYAELARRLGVSPRPAGGRSYRPVITVFAVAALIALALGSGVEGFMGAALVLLALLKLIDPPAFVSSFRQYNLLSQRLSSYGRLFPYLELLVGLALLAGLEATPIALLAIAMGAEGGLSVIKAVYLDKLDLDCACVGGNNRTPLGLVSVLENGVMVAMGLVILVQRG